MYITQLSLKNFRNFSDVTIHPSPKLNIIIGENGTGKTSILEGIYYLSLVKSFRTSKHSNIINFDNDEFIIFSRMNDESNTQHTEGINRKLNGDVKVVYNHKNVTRVSELATNLCVQDISPTSFSLLLDGPQKRREFLDWGVFYSFKECPVIYSDFKKVLKQRNALLQKRADSYLMDFWDKKFVELSYKISEYREKYLEIFNKESLNFLPESLNKFDITLSLSHGYKYGDDLLEQLKNNRDKEFNFGYTLYGPQKADVRIKAKDMLANQILSRGQQKLLITALHFTQGKIYQLTTGKKCIYLIDDISSELDKESLSYINKIIVNIQNDSQIFITSLDDSYCNLIDKSFYKKFIVANNDISESDN